MNIYLVVEGSGEKKVYRKWIPWLFPEYTIVNDLDKLSNNNIYIISGRGYPSYFDIIERAAEDVYTNPTINRLVVAVDSEEMSYDQKRKEDLSEILEKEKSCLYKEITLTWESDLKSILN